MTQPIGSDYVKRVSISLHPDVYDSLDELVQLRGFQSRSQAVAEMIQQSLIDHREELGSEVMAGTITLFYDAAWPGLLQALAKIERTHVDEVISSQHVLLESDHTMEVLLVQGPANRLKEISDKLITCKGVKSGRLTITSMILPPIHPLPEDSKKQ